MSAAGVVDFDLSTGLSVSAHIESKKRGHHLFIALLQKMANSPHESELETYSFTTARSQGLTTLGADLTCKLHPVKKKS